VFAEAPAGFLVTRPDLTCIDVLRCKISGRCMHWKHAAMHRPHRSNSKLGRLSYGFARLSEAREFTTISSVCGRGYRQEPVRYLD
jgi:hypothetical protein